MVTGFYAGILALVYVVLALRVINIRRAHKVVLGTLNATGQPVDALIQAVRIHGNFAEYVPFALVLILMCEIQDMARPCVHALGLVLLLGRLLHIVALSESSIGLRVAGMLLTFSVFVGAGLFLIFQAI